MDLATMLVEGAAIQRRSALHVLGSGVTLMAAGLVATEAKGKKGQHKAKKRCSRQASTCEAAFGDFCQRSGSSEECLAIVQECCAPFTQCDAGSAMDCFVFRFLTT